MRRQRVLTTALAFVALTLVILPAAALARSASTPVIMSYSNPKGNTIEFVGVNNPDGFYVNGKGFGGIADFLCYAGKVGGKKTWAPMYTNVLSGKLAQVFPNPDCAGFTGPIKGQLGKGGAQIVGPDFTVTGIPQA
jgi:hypothetical protein